jgi:hypothetical protein
MIRMCSLYIMCSHIECVLAQLVQEQRVLRDEESNVCLPCVYRVSTVCLTQLVQEQQVLRDEAAHDESRSAPRAYPGVSNVCLTCRCV